MRAAAAVLVALTIQGSASQAGRGERGSPVRYLVGKGNPHGGRHHQHHSAALRSPHAHPIPQNGAPLRAYVYRTDPYMAHIIDGEDPCWDPTVSFHGCVSMGRSDRHDVTQSYGLCQADPGTKMESAGHDWRTNPVTQLRWCDQYAVSRYGSEAAAWVFWQQHREW